ncbi:MAG: hypothetical protein OEV44_09075 [Spirochaetota bacterium]|nr:hypothetical protein [Spirochaetota bacterium]
MKNKIVILVIFIICIVVYGSLSNNYSNMSIANDTDTQDRAVNNSELSVSMVASTSLNNELPFEIYTGGSWKPENGAQFIKIHMYTDQPVSVSKIEIESCDNDFTNPVLSYINFDKKVEKIMGGKKILTQKLNQVMTLRSLTLNFQKNDPLCIKEVRLYDENNNQIKIKTPKSVEGSAKASNTLKPFESYDIMNLFDSRFEYGWSSHKRDSNVDLSFQFTEDQKIEKIRIWNGYQRSHTHCYSNSRVKTMRLTGDNGYNETVNLKDTMGSQDIILKKPFNGKNIIMKVLKSYRGKFYRDLVISEMRFFNGQNWFMLNPLSRVKFISKKNKDKFYKTEMNEILNKSLRGNEVSSNKSGSWKLRIRSDGSFFMEGDTSSTDLNKGKEKYEKFYTLGSYEILSSSKSKINITIFGLLRVYTEENPIEMDCNGCGRDCNKVKNSPEEEKLFRDYITISKSKDNFIVTHTPGRRKKISFSKVKMSIE